MKTKKLEFETSKGRFVLVDCDEQGKVLHPLEENIEIGRLKTLTEKMASEIVDAVTFRIGEDLDRYYKDYTADVKSGVTFTALDSLHSLIKSKSWYLDNPYKHPQTMEIIPASLNWWYEQEQKHIEAESRTLHNPVIFKIASDKV